MNVVKISDWNELGDRPPQQGVLLLSVLLNLQ